VHPVYMLHLVFKVAREFVALQGLIFFFPEDDTEVAVDVEKQLKGKWKGDDDHAKPLASRPIGKY
jgi:hypothetical protein